jgi:thiamine-monophosphate kinase
MNEFDLIEKYFKNSLSRADVILGSGDDCAIVEVPAGQQLALTTDTLVSGVHFPNDALPFDIGYKVLAVNLSDLAAMGATPAWVAMALTLPDINNAWLRDFANGFFALLSLFDLQLIGGDLTRGPLSITVQALGFLPQGRAVTRSGARVDDLIYVSNTLGDAGLALRFLRGEVNVAAQFQEKILARLNRPEPQVKLGKKLLGLASAAIDISDGLAGDLNHILKKSQVGAIITVDDLPLSPALIQSVTHEEAISLALNAGDDYELCFTTAPENAKQIAQLAVETDTALTCIGKVTAAKTFTFKFKNGNLYDGKTAGFTHF